ncbi:MAG: helix-turn-helix domain-containing protein [Gemmatimonadetes bacterium]|nr:helix-turn-helix domain-containing protein [Gemmatimonadota bacterium]
MEFKLPKIPTSLRKLRQSRGFGLKPLARLVGVTHSHLSRVERGEVQPSPELLERLAAALSVSAEALKLQAGVVPEDIAGIFAANPTEAATLVREAFAPYTVDRKPSTNKGGKPAFETGLGALYRVDCLRLLATLSDNSVDLVFADPPFNLGKNYGKGISDRRQEGEYLSWSRDWLLECIRVLSPGGALFVFNLPKWLIQYGWVLESHGMTFRHWIACRMPKSLPIPGRLSPAHYGLLYYTKEKPRVFNKVYVPIPSCRHCGGDIRDYGGHRKYLNEKGLNLMDVWDAPEDVWETADGEERTTRKDLWRDADEIWDDIPPVRHSKYKLRGANELAPLMLERVVAFASSKNDLILDPFAGTGTTLCAAEKLGRRWLGCDIGDIRPAVRRLKDLLSGDQSNWESARGHKGRIRSTAAQLTLLGG